MSRIIKPVETKGDYWLSGDEEIGVITESTEYSSGVMKKFETRERWWLHSNVNVFNVPEFYTLIWLIACYVLCHLKNSNTSKGFCKN